MLSKKNRLTKNKDFDQVFIKGKASYTGFIGLKCEKNGLEISRFGILVSTKVSKKAVVRNKIKRRIRQALFLNMDRLKNGYDCAVICRPAIAEKDQKEIRANLEYLFIKLKLLKKAA